MQTVDFFTPIVDDPFTFGAIAAANALSDVYAMGGAPISALSIVAFPATAIRKCWKPILRGGLEKMREAGCAVLGGHSVNDPEIKFGYAVTGTIHPERIKANAGARPGDALVFTKALGTGVIGTALKRGSRGEESVAAADGFHADAESRGLRSDAAVRSARVHGRDWLRHDRPCARDGGRERRARWKSRPRSVPLLPGALDAVRAGAIPGGLREQPGLRFVRGPSGGRNRSPSCSNGSMTPRRPEAC